MNAYRDILQREFTARVARNPRFSLRAFARALGLSPASLSLILSGKQGLGPVKAQSLALRLGLAGAERRDFLKSTDEGAGRAKVKRKVSGARTPAFPDLKEELQQGQGDILREWYTMAILELTELEGLELTEEGAPSAIAKRLGVNELAIKLALKNLLQLGLLKVLKGCYVQTQKEAFVDSEVPSASIRAFHDQMLSKARRSIDEQSFEDRELGALILPLAEEDFQKIRGEMRKFLRKLLKENRRPGPRDKLYCFSAQFFSLLQ